MYGDGNPFPYILITAGDTELDNMQRYTVVICGYTAEIKNKGRMNDTQVCGMDALRDYLTALGTVTKPKS